MIFVDIQALSLDETYDFELEEEMTAGELTEKIVKIIRQKERLSKGAEEEMHLFSLSREKFLNEGISLKKQGISSGEKLFLI